MRIALPVLVSLLLAAPLTAQSATPVGTDPLRAEVERLNAEMVDAFHRGDRLAVARFYSDSARIIGPRRRTVEGRAAIDAYWQNIDGPATWSLEVIAVGGTADEVYQIGISTLTSPGEGGATDTYTCDFVAIWKRESDGRLRMVLDFYN